MAYIANTFFEVIVSNAARDKKQNVAGYFGTVSDGVLTGVDCSAGQLAVRNMLAPLEGYQGAKDYQGNTVSLSNGNTWYFTKATAGTVAGRPGDETGIYACDTHDVQNVGGYNLGANTLGLGIPAGERGNFYELHVGDQICIGAGNLTTAVSTNGYAKVSADGLFTPAASAPTDGSVYFILRKTKPVNEGTSYVGVGYVYEVARSVSA